MVHSKFHIHNPSNYSMSTRVLASVHVRSQQFGNENIMYKQLSGRRKSLYSKDTNTNPIT